ncbi:hypothetical protein CHS0354_036828 [Potamilus streckersoni]|uniref:Uncharacterized protein n=1 Tax=Potamilus streckersoni TaxID=2493646 RepID=A0AAE0VLX3_9BIVA|nr:hypothetical protein CHS0354_036828 [Potamilus streckersoni]
MYDYDVGKMSMLAVYCPKCLYAHSQSDNELPNTMPILEGFPETGDKQIQKREVSRADKNDVFQKINKGFNTDIKVTMYLEGKKQDRKNKHLFIGIRKKRKKDDNVYEEVRELGVTHLAIDTAPVA